MKIQANSNITAAIIPMNYIRRSQKKVGNNLPLSDNLKSAQLLDFGLMLSTFRIPFATFIAKNTK
jgi:hypothetical protein